MRMKKLLMFLVLLTVSVGSWAEGTISTTDGVCTITLDNPSDLSSLSFSQTDLAATKVIISCSSDFTNADYSKINQFASATTLDMSGCTNADGISNLSMQNLQYLRLPSNFNTVASMSGLDTNNPKLEVAVSTDAIGAAASKIVIQSYKANGFYNSRAALNLTAEIADLKYITMSGMYGANDLHTNADGNIFGNTPAVWDFTGADFETITVSTPGTFSSMAPYYANDDPFADGAKNYPAANYPYTTNAFYYFSNYSQDAVKINLPTKITDLPDACLMGFGSNGQSNGNYDLAYPDANVSETNYVIEELVIPNNITRIGFDCASGCKVRKVVIGNGNGEDMTICGGAFGNSNDIEEVDFVPGISNCVIGNSAFNEGQTSQMKHITLPEGVTSLGVDCFNNSQHLESIRLPESLQYIGNGCFYDCHALSSITIPENVEQIGKQAFSLTALKDIYLTTTDPTKIPVMWSAGPQWADNNSSFAINEEFGNNSIPYADPGYGNWTWDETVDYLFSNSNRIAVLHFPDELALKVRAAISEQYDFETKDGFRIPSMSNVATWGQNLRGNISGADLGTGSSGKWTSDAWAQFLLMKAYDPDSETEVYEKEYDDVWYTMCFPFDLTDEQLAGAFTEDFNIVDFSAVEIRTDEVTQKKELVLHFNNVAETIYKDANGNKYVRKRDGADGLTGNVVREEDGNYSYNIYYKVVNGTPDTSVEYKHVSVGASGSTFKTKTFAAGGNTNGDILYIEGYLAQAGHPYMIHPNTGAKAGSPKVRCYFSGITWKEKDANGGYEQLYNDNARTVDLGVAKTDDNFNQAAYEGYAGQTYTFKGNWRAVREGTEVPTEPIAVADPGPEPTFSIPTEPTETLTAPPAAPTNPEANTAGWESAYNNLLQYLPQYPGYSGWANDGRWVTNGLVESTPISEAQYNDYYNRAVAYANYLTALASFDQAAYDRAYAAYLANLAAWAIWETYSANPNGYEATWENTVHTPWATQKADYDQYLLDYADWLDDLENYKVLIPKYAYFLARPSNSVYPKYYREMADESNRTGGFWNQYTAIIEPNDAAKSGIEGITASQGVKSYNIAFNEDYEGEFEPTEIKDIIAKAEEKGQKVEYMNIVYSINGEIVGQGSSSLNNLPKGMYIINGKKYLVK